MKIIIIGANRGEFLTIKRSQQDRHFIQTRNQLYKVYPDGFVRERCIDKRGKEPKVTLDETIIYSENAIRPYHMVGNVHYNPTSIKSDIDEHKLSAGSGIFRKSSFARAVQFYKNISPVLPLLLGGIILVFVVLANGGIKL